MRDTTSIRTLFVGTLAAVTLVVAAFAAWRLWPVWIEYREESRIVRELRSAPFGRGNWDYFNIVAEAELLPGGDLVLDALERELRDPDKYHRIRAAKALGRLGAKRDVVPRGLLDALSDPDHEVFHALKYAFPAIGANVVQPLCEVLSNDPDSHRRARAAEVLGNMGVNAEPAVPLLVQKMADDEPLVREWATWAAMFVEKRPDIVVPATVTLLDDEDAAVRIEALRCLVQFERLTALPKSAAPKLEALLEDPNASVQSLARMLLLHLNLDKKLDHPPPPGVR